MKKIKLNNKKIGWKKQFLVTVILSIFIVHIGTSLVSADAPEPPTGKITFIIKTIDDQLIPDATIGMNIRENKYWASEGTDRYYAMHEFTTNSGGIASFDYNAGSWSYWVKKDGYKTFTGTITINDNEEVTVNIKLALINSDEQSTQVKTPGFELLTLLFALFVTILLLCYKRK